MTAVNARSKTYLPGAMLIGWLSLIFLLSHQPGSGVAWEPTWWYIIERKSAHVIEYAVLMFLAFRFFRTLFPMGTLGRVILLAAVFSLAYGATDELHQFFIFGRGAKLSDVAVDGLGIACMSIAMLIFRRDRMKETL